MRNFKIQLYKNKNIIFEEKVCISEDIIESKYNGSCNANIVKHYWITNADIKVSRLIENTKNDISDIKYTHFIKGYDENNKKFIDEFQGLKQMNDYIKSNPIVQIISCGEIKSNK